MIRVGVLCAVLAVALLTQPARAAVQPEWTWTYLTNVQVSQWIEQASDWPMDPAAEHYVVNPGVPSPCAWDVDDHWSRVASGSLTSGQSVSATDCVISDYVGYYTTHNGIFAYWTGPTADVRLDLTVDAPSPDLVVTQCYAVQNRCFTASPVYDAARHIYSYGVCVQAVYEQGQTTLPAIPASNGGFGIYDTVNSTVANPTNKTIRKIVFNPRVTGVFTDCLVADEEHVEYPWRWWD